MVPAGELRCDARWCDHCPKLHAIPSVKVKAAGQAHFSPSRRPYELYGAWSAERLGALTLLDDANLARLAVSADTAAFEHYASRDVPVRVDISPDGGGTWQRAVSFTGVFTASSVDLPGFRLRLPGRCRRAGAVRYERRRYPLDRHNFRPPRGCRFPATSFVGSHNRT